MDVLAMFGSIIGVGLLFLLNSIFNGYVLSVLWGWFIVPTFGAPALGVMPAIGIAMVVNCLTYQTGSKENYNDNDGVGLKIVKVSIIKFGKPTLALFFGWVVHLFM